MYVYTFKSKPSIFQKTKKRRENNHYVAKKIVLKNEITQNDKEHSISSYIPCIFTIFLIFFIHYYIFSISLFTRLFVVSHLYIFDYFTYVIFGIIVQSSSFPSLFISLLHVDDGAVGSHTVAFCWMLANDLEASHFWHHAWIASFFAWHSQTHGTFSNVWCTIPMTVSWYVHFVGSWIKFVDLQPPQHGRSPAASRL